MSSIQAIKIEMDRYYDIVSMAAEHEDEIMEKLFKNNRHHNLVTWETFCAGLLTKLQKLNKNMENLEAMLAVSGVPEVTKWYKERFNRHK